MIFFTFRVKQNQQKCSNRQLKCLIEKINNSNRNIRFQQEWINKLLKLFESKQEIQLFAKLISQNHREQQTERQNNPFIQNVMTTSLGNQCQKESANQKQYPEFEDISPVQKAGQYKRKDFIDYKSFGRGNRLWSNQKGTYNYQRQQWKKSISQIVQTNPYLTLPQITNELSRKGHKKIPQFRMIRGLLAQMKYTKRRLNKQEQGRNEQNVLKLRKKYCYLYVNILNRESIRVFFIDQEQIYIKKRPAYAWVRVNNPLPLIQESQLINLLVVTGQDGSLMWQISQNTQNKQRDAIELVKNMTNHDYLGPLIVVIGDIPIRQAIVNEISNISNWKILLLPPKSEELNPTKYLFQQIKSRYQQQGITDNMREFKQTVNNICNNANRWKSYFPQIRRLAQEGLKTGKL